MPKRLRDDTAGTADALIRKLERDPGDREAYLGLHQHYEKTGDFASLLNLVTGLAEFTSDAAVAAAAYVEAGQLVERHLDDPARAEGYYQHALQHEPESARATAALRALREPRDPQLDDKPTVNEPEPKQRALLLLEQALRSQEAGDEDAAVSALERARALAPDDLKLTHALAGALVRRGAGKDARTRALDLDRVADLLCDVAVALEPSEARAFLASALSHAPWHARALYDLERTTPAAEQTGLAVHWVAYLAHNPEGDLANQRRVKLAQAYLAAGQTEDAVFALETAANSGDAVATQLLTELRATTSLGAVATTRPAVGAENNVVTTVGEAPIQPDADAFELADPDLLVEAEEEDAAPLTAADVLQLDAATELPETTPRASPLETEPVTPAEEARAPEPVLVGEPDAPMLLSEPDLPVLEVEPEAPALPHAAPEDEPRLLEAELLGVRAEMEAALTQNDPEQALVIAQRLLKHDPLDAAAFELADRHYRRTHDLRRRAELLEYTARSSGLPLPVRQQRLRDAVGLYEQKLTEPEAAVRAYRALHELDPDNDEVLRAMARQLERLGQWDALCECLEQSLRLHDESAHRIGLLRRLAEIHRRERNDRTAAAAALARLIDHDPNDRAARVALTEDLTALGRWPELTALLERRANEAGSKAERIGLLRQLATVFEGPLADPDAAFAAYETIITLAPEDVPALTRMEELDERAGAHERLLVTLERRVTRSNHAQAAQLLVRMAAIAETNLLDQPRALALLHRALTYAPQNAQIVTALLDLCERAGQFDELLGLLRERAQNERQPKLRAELLRRMARLLATQMQDAAGAAEAYAQLNELGDDLEAWTFLEQEARRRGDDEQLAAALHKLSDLDAEPAARRDHLMERSKLLSSLDRKAEAIEPLTRVLLDIDSEDLEGSQELETLCAEISDFRSLARVLEGILAGAKTPEQRASTARQLASMYANQLPDEARAQKALLSWAQATPDDPEVWRRLSVVHERKRRHKELLEAYDALGRLEPDADARAAAQLAAASLCWMRLKDAKGALQRIEAYAHTSKGPIPEPLIELARKADGLGELCALCEATGRYEQLFALLRERIAKSLDPQQKIDLHRQLATALVEHRQDEDGALAAYEGLLSLGDDVEALRFVQAWAAGRDDPERLAAVLLRLARSESNPEERRDLWMERGRLLRVRLGQPREAISAFEQALAVDPQFEPALDELIATCEAAADHARLASALERKLLANPREAVPLLERLGTLYEDSLGDEAKVIRSWTRWSELERDNPEPLRRLRIKYRRAHKPTELIATLDGLARRERDPAARVEASVAAAELAYEELADGDGALARLLPLVAANDPEVDRALLTIAEHAKRLPEVYDRLEQAGRYTDLTEQLTRAATRENDSKLKASLLRRAARIQHERLNDVERASNAYAELLALEEDAEALRFMQARALEADNAGALADVLLRLSKLETEPRELRDLLYDYAHLQNFRLRAPAKAIPTLRRILEELDPSFEPALDELISAAEAADDSAALAVGLERALERETDRGRMAELAERLAGLYRGALNDDPSAQRTLQTWAKLAPNNLVPFRALRLLFQKHGQHALLLECLDHISMLTESRDERQEASLAAARLCTGPLHDGAAAFVRLTDLMRGGVVQAEDALHALARESDRLGPLCDVYEHMGRYEDVCELLRERAELETDPLARADLLQRCARLLSDIIGDQFAAAETYREVLRLRDDAEALQFLRAIAERQDDVDTLDELLARLVPLTEPDARGQLVLSRALLLRDRLTRPEQAASLLQAALSDTDAPLTDVLRARVVVELKATAAQTHDLPSLALALESELAATREGGARRDLALRLADLYERELNAPDRAADALRVACSADPRNIDARRRLKLHLARQAAWPEYVSLLDTLAHLPPNPSERREARLAAASAVYQKLGDAPSALVRLTPLIMAGDADAEQLAETICRVAGHGRELANMYMARARQATTPADAERSWREVMKIQELWLADPAEAFEAALRLLAADPQNRRHLDDVDRLAVIVGAVARLTQIYAKLIRAAPSDAARVELSVRLSRLIEKSDGDAGVALEYALQAARIAPLEPRLVDRVAQLAAKNGSHTELMWAQEQRALASRDPAVAIDAWLAAARTADLSLHDREQANACLRRALALTELAPDRIGVLEQTATELDAQRPELGIEDARRALLRAHLTLAEQAGEDFRTQLVLRAARFAREVLQDESGGFDVLRGGAGLPPFADALLDALEEAAVRIGRLDALDAQLARSAERSDTPADKRRLLARRARVLTERLNRYDQAAQVYERLLELSPSDTEAAEHWFTCLRRAGRHRELLRACERRLLLVQEPLHRLPLMREMATIWEVELKNRASAVAIWNDVRAIAPRDEEAARALERLKAGSGA